MSVQVAKPPKIAQKPPKWPWSPPLKTPVEPFIGGSLLLRGMGDKKPTITPNGDEEPFRGDTEGENETVMRSIIAAMVEALLYYLTMENGYVFNTNLLRNTRKAANYTFKKEAASHTLLGKMAKYMNINQKKITSFDLTVNGCSHLSVYFNDGQPPQRILMSSPIVAQLLKGKTKGAKKFQRAAAAYVAFQEWNQLTVAKQEEKAHLLAKKTGQAIEEVPEGMRLTPSVAAAAFDLEVGSPVRYFEIENHAMLRKDFHAMKADLEKSGESFIDVSSHTLRVATLEEYSEDSHLTVNVYSMVPWFRTSVFPTARYCSRCQSAYGVQQTKKGCPQCGNPKRNLGYNSNTAHLPFIESNEEGLKMVGGHRLLMKSFILPKKAFNALMLASQGLMASSDALKILMASTVTIRKQMEGRTVKVKARLVPAWYECVNATHKEDRFGLVLETLHHGDL